MKNYAIGIDVGGTTCKLGLFTTDGKLLMKDEIPTNTENGGSKILPDLAAKVDSILADRKIEKILWQELVLEYLDLYLMMV